MLVPDRGFLGDKIWDTVDTRYMMSGVASLFILSRHFKDSSIFLNK